MYTITDWLGKIYEAIKGMAGGSPVGPTGQVQSDWKQTNSSKPDFIKNKPDLAQKQDKLVSGENIKTINGQTLLGDGNIVIKGGGGSSVLENDLVVSNPLGKYTQGETIPKGTSWEEIMRKMMSQTYYPTLTAPSASINFTLPSLAEVGQTVNGGSVKVNFNRGSINPQYTAESGYRAGAATDYALALANADTQFSENNDNGNFTLPSFTKSSKGNVTLTGVVTHEAGPQPKDSDGNNYQTPLAAGTVSATKTIKFIVPFYHGASATNDFTDLAGLTKDLKEKGNKTYSYDTANEYVVIAYDASYGALTSILDQNGFELIDGFVVRELTVGGQAFKVYVQEDPTTDTGAAYTFKF